MSDDDKRKYRRLISFKGYLRTLVALKLRELEHHYESFDQFVAATGFPSGQVFKLLRGMQNVTTDTIDTLAINLRIPVWELLNAPVYTRNGKIVENTSVDHKEIFQTLWAHRELEIDTLKGGKRRDWVTGRLENMRSQKKAKAARAAKQGVGKTKPSKKTAPARKKRPQTF